MWMPAAGVSNPAFSIACGWHVWLDWWDKRVFFIRMSDNLRTLIYGKKKRPFTP